MEQGTRTRTTAATHMNANSSRSHMLIILQLKQVQEAYVSILETLLRVSEKAPNIIHSQIFSKENITKQSTVNLVDLAGSERQRLPVSEADRLKEGTAINLSLTTLGNVIRFPGSSARLLPAVCSAPSAVDASLCFSSSLADVAAGKKGVHVPYRDSVLTKLLQSALGGNSRTVMVRERESCSTGNPRKGSHRLSLYFWWSRSPL